MLHAIGYGILGGIGMGLFLGACSNENESGAVGSANLLGFVLGFLAVFLINL